MIAVNPLERSSRQAKPASSIRPGRDRRTKRSGRYSCPVMAPRIRLQRPSTGLRSVGWGTLSVGQSEVPFRLVPTLASPVNYRDHATQGFHPRSAASAALPRNLEGSEPSVACWQRVPTGGLSQRVPSPGALRATTGHLQVAYPLQSEGACCRARLLRSSDG